MNSILNCSRLNYLKLICLTITLVASLSVTAQTNPKQALVRYQLAQQYLPDFDSLRQDKVVTSNEYDSLLRNVEREVERAYNEVASRHGNGYISERYQEIGDSLTLMQEEMFETQKTLNLIIARKEVLHEEILIKSFQQLSLEFCKVRSLDLLLDAEPLYSKGPVVDLTDEFILFLKENR